MRWERKGRSRNLEDRRGGGGGGFRMPRLGGGRAARIPRASGRRPGGGMSITTLLVMGGIMWMLGINPLSLLGGGGGAMPGGMGASVGVGGAGLPGVGSAPPSGLDDPQEEDMVQFVSFVLDDLQQTWTQIDPSYRDAKLVLFRDSTRSACGTGQASMGPFYCPGDEKVYVDLSFFEDLRRRFGAPGDFAQAYVIAHEIGHHIQRLTGTEKQVRAEQKRSPRSANGLSVRMELQADCLAGVWGHSTAKRGILEKGDIEEGLRAASAIGDDHIQEMSGQGVRPESFTHGSSDQRVRWLKRGLETGDPSVCNTFQAASL